MVMSRLEIDPGAPDAVITASVQEWVATHVPESWREAAARGGAAAVRTVRTREQYEEWYPLFAASGMVVPALPVEYGGLGVESRVDCGPGPGFGHKPLPGFLGKPRFRRRQCLCLLGGFPLGLQL